MKLNKEEQELFARFCEATLQGWMSRYPSDALISQVNQGVVANGVARIAATMLKVYQQNVTQGAKADDRE